VSEKTQNRIQSVIDPPIADDVMMYLINAIYFKGEWKNAFDKNNTGEADFYSYDGVTDKVQMMRKTDTFALAELEECSAVALPYGDEKVAMAVILPKKDINKFISNFDGEKWNELVKSFKTVNDLRLEIPKFRMEYGVKELNKALASLGMGEVFSKNADFGGIAEDICMDSVFHKAVVEVNEEGTEAVAATSVIIMTTSLEEPKTFIANRPFVFVIYDTEEGNILFIGKKLYGDR
jgi:serine protease inhibitor